MAKKVAGIPLRVATKREWPPPTLLWPMLEWVDIKGRIRYGGRDYVLFSRHRTSRGAIASTRKALNKKLQPKLFALENDAGKKSGYAVYVRGK